MLKKVLISQLGLAKGEFIKKMVRRSLWSKFWLFLFSAVFIITPFFLIYPLFNRGVWGVAVFFIILISGLILALRTYLSHYFTVFVMTDLRVAEVDQKGFFDRSVCEVSYDKIQDVTYQLKGIFSALFKLGDIYISFTDDERTKLKLPKMKNPAALSSEILNWRTRHSLPAVKNAQFLLEKIRCKVGEDAFNNLISD